MPISDQEKSGIADLLVTEAQNIPILLQLAKSVTKNVCNIESVQEALDIIYTHIGDAHGLLNKRHLTKEVLFKYLHSKRVKVTADFTKTTLVNKVLEHWNQLAAETTEPRLNDESTAAMLQDLSPSTHLPTSTSQTQNFPIHLLARKFTEWFFENYNKSNLKLVDFWSDVRLHLRIAANDRMDEQNCIGAECVSETLMHSKLQFGFYFNPNLSHAGVQGRMDIHGLVLVLACGTIHTAQNCVGVFECTFGLLRDPFAENNWKMKTVQLTLRSEGKPQTPILCESDTLRVALTLPVPEGEFT